MLTLFYSLFLLITLGFIWGSGYSLAKFAMTHGVPPLGYSFWQACGPAALLLTMSLFGNRIAFLSPRFWGYFFVCGCLGIAIPNSNMYYIAAKIPAGLLAVLVNTVPLIVYPLAVLCKQERKDPIRIMAITLGFFGIMAIINPNINNLLSNWALLALISPLCFAFCAIYITAKQPEPLHPLDAACGMLLAATLLLTPLVWQQQSFYSFHWPLSPADGAILLEVILSTLGYLIFFRLIRLAGPVFYSLTGTVVALTGLFWGYLLYNETLNFLDIFGIVIIINALLLLTLRQIQQPH